MIVLATVTTLLAFDLAADDGAFVSAGSTGQWEWGVPNSGPGGAQSLWGTNLDGNHFNDAVDTLEIPLPDLGTAGAPVLVLEHWYDLSAGDNGTVQIDSGGGWVTVQPVYGYPHPSGFVGTSIDWERHSILLADYGASPRLRLVLDADVFQAADGWYLRSVTVYDGDATPPQIAPVLVPVDTEDLAGPYRVVMSIDDEAVVASASLDVAVNGGAATAHVMSDIGGGLWEGFIPGVGAGSLVAWQAVASDGENEARWPEDEVAEFSVQLPRPTGLQGPSGRIVAATVPLSWRPPNTAHEVTGYLVEELGSDEPPTELSAPGGAIPVDPEADHVFTVRAVYAVGVSPPSDPLALDVSVPLLTDIAPGGGFQGDTVYVELHGQDLYLHSDFTDVSFGLGVRVDNLAVLDANALTAVVTIDPDAATGFRDATVTGAHGGTVFPDAFLIGDGALLPRIIDVKPGVIHQAETRSLTVTAAEPFAGGVTVDPGPGLIVTSDVVVEGAVATFELLALGTAATGERLMVLDDGSRLWPARLDVREYADTDRGCDSGGTGSWGWPLVVGLLWRRRAQGLGGRARQPPSPSRVQP